ncbi:MAG: hypothetical protein U0L20_06445 [Ruminococcus sp.]|nr:hypothetical protein [Ruminococcus sp.]
MYRCSDCGNSFDEVKKIVEKYNGLNLPDGGYREVYYLCPVCGSDDYKEEIVGGDSNG